MRQTYIDVARLARILGSTGVSPEKTRVTAMSLRTIGHVGEALADVMAGGVSCDINDAPHAEMGALGPIWTGAPATIREDNGWVYWLTADYRRVIALVVGLRRRAAAHIRRMDAQGRRSFRARIRGYARKVVSFWRATRRRQGNALVRIPAAQYVAPRGKVFDR